MSNQVYSNEIRKFYELPGMNNYVMAGDVNIMAATVDAPNTIPTSGAFNFTSGGNTVQNDSSLTTIGNTYISINKEGMYSIKLFCLVENGVNSVTNDIDCDVKITLTRTGDLLNGLIVDRHTERCPAPGVITVGSTFRYFSLNFNGYLRVNDVLTFGIDNYSSDSLMLKASGTQLLVNKIY